MYKCKYINSSCLLQISYTNVILQNAYACQRRFANQVCSKYQKTIRNKCFQYFHEKFIFRYDSEINDIMISGIAFQISHIRHGKRPTECGKLLHSGQFILSRGKKICLIKYSVLLLFYIYIYIHIYIYIYIYSSLSTPLRPTSSSWCNSIWEQILLDVE